MAEQERLPVRRSMLPDLDQMDADLRDLFRGVWSARWPLASWRPLWMGAGEPAVDVFERDGNVVVKAEVPGIEPDQVEVTISGRELRISGSRKEEKDVKEEHYFRSERAYGRIYRALMLPEGCDTEAVNATMRHGVLEVVIPKAKQSVAKKIVVKSVG